MTTIEGTISKGIGLASRCLVLQMPLLLPYVPDIMQFHVGTINLHLDQPLAVKQFDIDTPLIHWYPQDPHGERFSILRVTFQPHSDRHKSPVPALIYWAHRSPHRSNPFMAEIITHKLDLTGVSRCSVNLKHSCREVRWLVVDGKTDISERVPSGRGSALEC